MSQLENTAFNSLLSDAGKILSKIEEPTKKEESPRIGKWSGQILYETSKYKRDYLADMDDVDDFGGSGGVMSKYGKYKTVPLHPSPDTIEKFDTELKLDTEFEFLDELQEASENPIMAKVNKKISVSAKNILGELKAPPAEMTFSTDPFVPSGMKVKGTGARRSANFGTMRVSQEGLKMPTTPSEIEDLDWLKESLGVYISQEPIIVYAISIDKEQKEHNLTNSIRCFGGIAFGGYAHDVSKDSYLIQAVEYLQLGNLPFSFVISIPSAGNWKAKIPAPEKVIEKYFSPDQRKALELFREKYKTPKYEIQFIQMLGCDF
jgi:hypothetical protein